MPHYHPDAVAVATDPGRFARHPALLSDAWMRLKEQQGHPVTRPRLERLEAQGHRPGSATAPAEVIEFHAARTLRRTRAAIMARGMAPTGGDAA